MKDEGWTVLVFLTIIALCCAPDWLFVLLFVIFGMWFLHKGKRYTGRGQRPPSPSEMIEDVFIDRKKNRRKRR